MVHNKHSFCSYFDLTAASNYSYGTPITALPATSLFYVCRANQVPISYTTAALAFHSDLGGLNDNTLAILQCGAKW